MGNTMWMFFSIYNYLLTILFPPLCFVCKQGGEIICDNCTSSLNPSLDTPSPNIFPLLSFKDARVRKIIHTGKYYGRKDLLQILSEKIVSQLPSLPIDTRETLCVPVPIHYVRRIIRGYNQAEIIAKSIANHYKVPLSSKALKKRSYTRRQVSMGSRKARLQNERNTFSVHGNLVGKTIIVIDDVTTTGATLEAIQEELYSAGAKHVYAITLAH